MPYRQIPKSALGFEKAMEDADSKSTSSPDDAITADTLTQLGIIKPQYNAKIAG